MPTKNIDSNQNSAGQSSQPATQKYPIDNIIHRGFDVEEPTYKGACPSSDDDD